MNKVILIGRLTKDPILTKTSQGTPVVQFTIALNQGDKTHYIDIVAWNQTAENTFKFVKKGHLVGVIGSIQTRTYDDKNGKKHKVFEILANSVQFMEPKVKQEETKEATEEQNSLPF